jgi:membrane protein YqaA with SNARE-associated domain
MEEKKLSEAPVPVFTLRPWSLWAGFLWGFAEATLFFIVPDVLLTFIALYSFRRSFKVLAFILLGALVGGTLMFFVGHRSPEQSRAVVLRVPFVSSAMFDRTHQSFERNGIWALTKGPASGIPYKVYCVQASRYSGWPLFLVASVLARMERFALFWAIAGLVGLIFRKSIRRQPTIAAAVHACIWIMGYAWYWTRI